MKAEMNFEELSIDAKLRNKIYEFGFKDLTSIQEKCIPEILKGRDIVGQAETGSGKTLAFCLPILDMITPDNGLQVLVLTPTRELCIQVTNVFKDFGRNLGIKIIDVYGGVSIKPQMMNIPKSNIIVATPVSYTHLTLPTN